MRPHRRGRGGQEPRVEVGAARSELAPAEPPDHQVWGGVPRIMVSQETRGARDARGGVLHARRLGSQRPGPRCGPPAPSRPRCLASRRIDRIGIRLQLLLEELPGDVLDLFQGLAERAVARRSILELLLPQLVEPLNRLEAAVEIGHELLIPRLRRRVERLVELFGGQPFLTDRRLPRRLLLLVPLGVGFVADGARLLVLEDVVAGLVQRHHPDAGFEVSADPVEGPGPELGVAAFELGIEMVPELLQQSVEEPEARAQPPQGLLLEQRLGQPSGDLQVLGLRSERVAGQLDDERPVGDLARALPVALLDVVFLAPGLFDLVVDRVVAEVRPRRIRPRDRLQQVFLHRHGGGVSRPSRRLA